jgi:two-component system, OmpR family, sensor histidine kinase KdpD
VFEKFTRGEKESAKPGIGLGLAICRAILEAHGGTIGALNRMSAEGRVEGARFWFTLPVETPPDAPDAPDVLDDEGADPLNDERADRFAGPLADPLRHDDPTLHPHSKPTHE